MDNEHLSNIRKGLISIMNDTHKVIEYNKKINEWYNNLGYFQKLFTNKPPQFPIITLYNADDVKLKFKAELDALYIMRDIK